MPFTQLANEIEMENIYLMSFLYNQKHSMNDKLKYYFELLLIHLLMHPYKRHKEIEKLKAKFNKD